MTYSHRNAARTLRRMADILDTEFPPAAGEHNNPALTLRDNRAAQMVARIRAFADAEEARGTQVASERFEQYRAAWGAERDALPVHQQIRVAGVRRVDGRPVPCFSAVSVPTELTYKDARRTGILAYAQGRFLNKHPDADPASLRTAFIAYVIVEENK